MSDFRRRYRTYWVIASLCTAVFIVNLAFCLMCTDKYIYKITYEKWIEDDGSHMDAGKDEAGEEENLTNYDTRPSQFQAEFIFDELSDGFLSFFGNDYELTGYELNSDNVKNLNALKWRFRKSVIFVILSVAGFVYCYAAVLNRRRDLSPFIYGGVIAAVFTAVRALMIVFAKHGVRVGIRAMILNKDYGYFSSGDILSSMLPPSYARFMGLLYIGWVLVLIAVVLLVRRMIIFAGRPHKF